MMKKLLELFRKFMASCKKSKKQAAINISALIGATIIIGGVLATATYVALKLLAFVGSVVVLIFVCYPQLWEQMKINWQRSKQIPCIFPAYIGWLNGRVMPDMVNKEFSEICELFQVCYLISCQDIGNRVVYAFKTIPRQDIPVNYELLRLVQGMGEKIMTNKLLEYAVTAPINDMVAVSIDEDILRISFAKNNNGLAETVQCQKNMYLKYHLSDIPDQGDFTETWDG